MWPLEVDGYGWSPLGPRLPLDPRILHVGRCRATHRDFCCSLSFVRVLLSTASGEAAGLAAASRDDPKVCPGHAAAGFSPGFHECGSLCKPGQANFVRDLAQPRRLAHPPVGGFDPRVHLRIP